MTDTAPEETTQEKWARRFGLPVLVAALAAVPALFLTLLPEPWTTVGLVVNIVSGAVLTAETVVLFVVSADKRAWLRRQWWLVLLTVLIVIGVVLALGPVQILRLVRVVAALRVLGVRRILRSGQVLVNRVERVRPVLPRGIAAVLVLAFSTVVLVNPDSPSRRLLADLLPSGTGAAVAVVGGLGLAVATWLVLRGRPDEEEPGLDEATAQREAGQE
ncbi:ion transporter [Ruania alba]|uniref:Uncharacterized protein n=1 Tax=Ruania alba TaxID=648782 RepID=A0A1H5B8E7_9MICO|nr:ion transporter [Ruania alba]SED50220.1 hypothetical protein SAMN04488554_0026 [Ruania alba]